MQLLESASNPMVSAKISKAILLVGGKGTRLQPLTNTVPKPMIRIAGKPVTEHQIIKARDAGITEIVLATSYLAEVFKPYFGDGSAYGVKLTYAVEESPLGTGGAIAYAADHLDLRSDESVFIFNGDVLSGHNLQAQAEVHHSKSADVTLHLTMVADARAYGCVPIDQSGRVSEFLEKMENPKANTINAGCYIFSSRAIGSIPLGAVVSVERETFPTLLSSGHPIYGFEDSRYWIDMGTPQAMIKASSDLILNPTLSGATPEVTHEALFESGVTIDPTSKIIGGSFIASGAQIGPRSTIISSIISEKVVIEADSTVRDSFIAPGSRVKSGSKIENSIFGF